MWRGTLTPRGHDERISDWDRWFLRKTSELLKYSNRDGVGNPQRETLFCFGGKQLSLVFGVRLKDGRRTSYTWWEANFKRICDLCEVPMAFIMEKRTFFKNLLCVRVLWRSTSHLKKWWRKLKEACEKTVKAKTSKYLNLSVPPIQALAGHTCTAYMTSTDTIEYVTQITRERLFQTKPDRAVSVKTKPDKCAYTVSGRVYRDSDLGWEKLENKRGSRDAMCAAHRAVKFDMSASHVSIEQAITGIRVGHDVYQTVADDVGSKRSDIKVKLNALFNGGGKKKRKEVANHPLLKALVDAVRGRRRLTGQSKRDFAIERMELEKNCYHPAYSQLRHDYHGMISAYWLHDGGAVIIPGASDADLIALGADIKKRFEDAANDAGFIDPICKVTMPWEIAANGSASNCTALH